MRKSDLLGHFSIEFCGPEKLGKFQLETSINYTVKSVAHSVLHVPFSIRGNQLHGLTLEVLYELDIFILKRAKKKPSWEALIGVASKAYWDKRLCGDNRQAN